MHGDLLCTRTDVEKEEAWIEKLSRKRVCPTSQIKAKSRSGSKETHKQGAGYELSTKTSVGDGKCKIFHKGWREERRKESVICLGEDKWGGNKMPFQRAKKTWGQPCSERWEKMGGGISESQTLKRSPTCRTR